MNPLTASMQCYSAVPATTSQLWATRFPEQLLGSTDIQHRQRIQRYRGDSTSQNGVLSGCLWFIAIRAWADELVGAHNSNRTRKQHVLGTCILALKYMALTPSYTPNLMSEANRCGKVIGSQPAVLLCFPPPAHTSSAGQHTTTMLDARRCVKSRRGCACQCYLQFSGGR